MNREDFQQLATLRLEEAKEHNFPPDPETVKQVYSHRLSALLVRAGLEGKVSREAPEGSPLDRHWATVLRWKEDSRYRPIDTGQARTLYNAIAEARNGVLVWLQRNW